MAKKEEKVIRITEIKPVELEITIVGDSDLILNKMDDRTEKNMLDKQSNRAPSLEPRNMWEDVITSLHWYYGKPADFSEEGLADALKNNAPAISAFGLKKSFKQTVVRFEIDTYSTKFDASVNVLSKDGLIPIRFKEHQLIEKLVRSNTATGTPVLARFNVFSGWEATFTISLLEKIYSKEEIISIVNLAGFGIGIGSGRTTGYGRYHIESVAEKRG